MHACVPVLGTNAPCLPTPQQMVSPHKKNTGPSIPPCSVGDVESLEAAQTQRELLNSSSSPGAVVLVSTLEGGMWDTHQAGPILNSLPAS